MIVDTEAETKGRHITERESADNHSRVNKTPTAQNYPLRFDKSLS